MGVSQQIRFENHMDVSSPETMGDAEKISDFIDENPYDDEFEAKLSQVDKNSVSEVTQEKTNISTHECSAFPSDSIGYNRSIQQISEKVIAVASMMEAVGDMLNGGISAIEQPNRTYNDDMPPQTSIISNEGHHDVRLIDEVIDELGFEIDGHNDNYIEDIVIDAGQVIETIGNDSDNQAEYIAEKTRRSEENIDSDSLSRNNIDQSE